jgi:hypothetical protein
MGMHNTTLTVCLELIIRMTGLRTGELGRVDLEQKICNYATIIAARPAMISHFSCAAANANNGHASMIHKF